MKTLLQDLQYGARMLMKRPSFTLIAILTLALGIGASTAIFSVADALLLRSLPYPGADQLMLLREVDAEGIQMPVSAPNFADVQLRSRSFAALAISAGSAPVVVTGGREAARTLVSVVSGRFFEVMGVQPIAGRTFLPEEEKYGGPVAALVSYGYWQKMLGGRADWGAINLSVSGIPCQVVGVMPAGFNYPAETEIWISNNISPPDSSRTAHNWSAIGRLRAGITLQQARIEVSLIGKQLRQSFGEGTDAADFALIPLQAYLTRDVSKGLWLLLGAVGLLLLVACANFSNLLLAQFTVRQRELTVRAALGASKWRLARQLVIENLLVTLPAATAGTLLARLGIDLLSILDRGILPQVNAIAIDWRALLFACAVAILIAVVLGLLPGLRSGNQDLQTGLKESGRGQSAEVKSKRLRGALVVVQISLTFALLYGAGLLSRSFF
jgi:putative ABC transport system permease protein